jgi:hypothetical protein
MLFQQNVDAAGNRVYGIFLYVVMADNELQERTWTRDIRYLQFAILNSEGRQLKDKTTVALYRENQMSWGFPGLLDNSILLRDPVVNSRRTIDIVCRLRYHPNQEKLRRPLSPGMPGGYLNSSMMANGNATTRSASTPAGYWGDQKAPTQVVDPVGKDLKKLLNNRDFSDLEILVGPERQVFYAHKALLAVRSEWFRSALRPGCFREAREGRMTLPDDDPKIFEALLEFLYTGEYPIGNLDAPRTVAKAKQPEPMHFSPRSPPVIPPRNGLIADSNPDAMNTTFSDAPTPDVEPTYETYHNYEPEPEEEEEYDDQKFALFLMADKYGITQLKTLIRIHLSNELLDTASSTSPGQRLLRLIRFAFEDLPESTRTATPSGRDSGVGGSLTTMSERGMSPPGYRNHNPFSFGNPGVNGYSLNELENREGTASAFGHNPNGVNSDGTAVGVAMTTERRSLSRVSQQAAPSSEFGNGNGIYGRDNETTLLRESITAYVAKMYHTVNKLEGFDDLLREGGEIGAFSKMVMESMFGSRTA